jgi:hypothetical protein
LINQGWNKQVLAHVYETQFNYGEEGGEDTRRLDGEQNLPIWYMPFE